MCLSSVAQAHNLQVFATLNGEQVEGYVGFAGGGRAAGISVELRDGDGKPLLRSRSDQEGRFRFRLPGPGRFVVMADSGAGHVTRFPLESGSRVAEPRTQDDSRSPHTVIDQRSLDRLLARHINPLREQIAAYEERRRWHDVLGGIGYILGLAGVAFFFLARKGH
jgi:nickel transport protein